MGRNYRKVVSIIRYQLKQHTIMKYSLACICGYETPHVENKKDVDDELIYIHQEYCEVYIKELKKNPIDMKKKLLIAAAILTLSSCGMFSKLTDEQLSQRSKLDYEMNKLWNEYQVKNDSLLIEYYKIK